MASSLVFVALFVLSVSTGELRAHGLEDHNSPILLSPEMYAYFHPNTQQPNTNLCNLPDCSFLAATRQSASAHERSRARRALAAGGIAGIPVGFIFAILFMAGVYYVIFMRQVNAERAKYGLQPDV
ncbi:hypothetical protein SASPL_122823 [Salvia splendens]|uniref:Uncharacterized protein n=1 Tax=Salvia splendens TaxID=180675 RepID=A0A8X8ZRJ2_SALSN|nr:hypothetical protein SASPL_122823 [Salvia splendens]